MKNIFSRLALFLLFAFLVGSLMWKESFFVSLAEESSDDDLASTDTFSVECPANSENEYYNAAFGGGDSGISVDAAIDLFLTNQDIAFSDYISQFSGASLTCGLSRLGEESMSNLSIQTPQEFSDERSADLRMIDCALFALGQDGRPFACPTASDDPTIVLGVSEALGCDATMRRSLGQRREDLIITMKILLEEIDELVLAYPLHKQLECLHEEILSQREKLLEILKLYAAIRASHPSGTDK